jgi:hypothetical protein
MQVSAHYQWAAWVARLSAEFSTVRLMTHEAELWGLQRRSCYPRHDNPLRSIPTSVRIPLSVIAAGRNFLNEEGSLHCFAASPLIIRRALRSQQNCFKMLRMSAMRRARFSGYRLCTMCVLPPAQVSGCLNWVLSWSCSVVHDTLG